MTIRYYNDVRGVNPDQLRGFFVGWPDPPSPATHLRLLLGSYRAVLAFDETTGQVVGFITAVSDGILSAYIPLLEVLPAYQGSGIGQTLVQMMLDQLRHLYMVDLTCDAGLKPYYERFGMTEGLAMLTRRYGCQSGEITGR